MRIDIDKKKMEKRRVLLQVQKRMGSKDKEDHRNFFQLFLPLTINDGAAPGGGGGVG